MMTALPLTERLRLFDRVWRDYLLRPRPDRQEAQEVRDARRDETRESPPQHDEA